MSSPILRYFSFQHLPVELQAVSAPIADLAEMFDDLLPDCAEKAAGLRKLLEAKDALVRAALPNVGHALPVHGECCHGNCCTDIKV